MSNGLSDFLASFEDKDKKPPKEPIEQKQAPKKEAPKEIKEPEPIKKESNQEEKEGSRVLKLKINTPIVKQETKEVPKQEKETAVKKETKEKPRVVGTSKAPLDFDPLDPSVIQNLFEESETEEVMRDEWIEYYRKGWRSSKRTETVRKLITGRFRILRSGEIEILSDMKTKGSTVQDIFKSKWI